MVYYRIASHIGVVCIVLATLATGPGLRAETSESRRLDRARDFIADEQWGRAIAELKAAADDTKEANRDEALFWLAHSQNQTRDSESALETIRRLEREFPASRWVKPARSLRIEIAHRLQRNDVLWLTAAPPQPPQLARPAAPPTPVATLPAPPAPPVPPASRVAPPVPPRPSRVPSPVPAGAVPPPAPPAPAAPPWPPAAWMPEHYLPDTDERIQALGSLIRTDAVKVIPMLKVIALNSGNLSESRRALFVLVHSGRPDARATVVDVARTGPEPVKIVAVRELGRLDSPGVSTELLRVYATATARVKIQVVTSLGQREATTALMRIAQSETDRDLRDTAIATLGQAGGLEQLRILYGRAGMDAKRPIIVGFFHAHADEELIRIAEGERDPAVREEVLRRLRLLGTPRAKQYLEQVKQK